MVGLHAGGGGRTLGDIQAVHLVWLLAAAHEVAGIADESREPCSRKEITIQRDHNIGGGEFVLRIIIAAKGHLRADTSAVAMHRVVTMPPRLRISLLDGLHLRSKCW